MTRQRIRDHASALGAGLLAATMYALLAFVVLDGPVTDRWLELIGMVIVFYVLHFRRRRGRETINGRHSGLE